MPEKVLVAYGSKYGATAEIAERIGKTLKDSGLDVTVSDAKDVKDITPYIAIVLGSAVYMGQWRKPAARLLKNNVTALANKKVWFFSSGPTSEGDPVKGTDGWTFPTKLQPLADQIGAEDIALFHGKSNPNMKGFDKFIMSKIDPSMTDYRDWDMITTWAATIAAELLLADA